MSLPQKTRQSDSMKLLKAVCCLVCTVALIGSAAVAAEKTCCQKAIEAGKECKHKCCLVAHREGRSCQKCNPHKEDAKLIKKTEQTTDKKAEK